MRLENEEAQNRTLSIKAPGDQGSHPVWVS